MCLQSKIQRATGSAERRCIRVVMMLVHCLLSPTILSMLIHFGKGSLRKEFLREAIAWRSLSHRFILPFLGIYEKKLQLFLVSPLMENGTLTQWRTERERSVIEIHRMVRHPLFIRAIEKFTAIG